MTARSLLIALTLAVAGPSLAGADEPSTAERHHDAGTALFAAQRYAEAAESFRLSYELSGQPAILRNLSLCFEKLGQTERAIEYEERYGIVVTEEIEKSQSVARVARLKAALATPPATAVQAAPVADATPKAQPTWLARKRLGVGLSVGGGLLLAGGAIALGLGANTAHTLQAGNITLADYNTQADQARAAYAAGGVLSALGGGALVGGVVLLVQSARSSGRPQ